jgi:hypothetical protein
LWAPCDFSEFEQVQLSPNAIQCAFERLVELIAIAAENTRLKSKDSGGQPSKLPLLHWTINARRFWETTLGRKFDHHQNRKTGSNPQAFEFCRMALAPLEPNIDDGSLRHAMRRSKDFLRNSLVSFT